MRSGQATITAVLSTLVRATQDERAVVILRTGRADQARELAHWLARAHGSRRCVIASATCTGDIEVRLPVRMAWPPIPARTAPADVPLAAIPPAGQLSLMQTFPLPSGRS